MPTNLPTPMMNVMVVLSLWCCGCVDMTLPDDAGDDTIDETADEADAMDTSEPLPDMPAETTREEGYQPGEMWGPCPIDEGGTIDLCFEQGTACVPTQDGNMCLPIGACPSVVPIGTAGELGWGDACYPRCSGSDDCDLGMICDVSLNGEPMCAWRMA